MARVVAGFLALAFIRLARTRLTLTNGFVSKVGEYLLTAAANKLIRKNVRLTERKVVVDVMKLELELISELRHMRSARAHIRRHNIGESCADRSRVWCDFLLNSLHHVFRTLSLSFGLHDCQDSVACSNYYAENARYRAHAAAATKADVVAPNSSMLTTVMILISHYHLQTFTRATSIASATLARSRDHRCASGGPVDRTADQP
jgi:hypothetical protein